MQKILFICCCLLSVPLVSQAQKEKDKQKDSIEISGKMTAFLNAFNNLEWQNFRSFIDEEATVFVESDTLTLVDGKAGIEKVFLPIFEETPKHIKGPPYLRIHPVNMNIHVQGDLAVVSFHMKRGNSISRRSFVWQRKDRNWLIVHIHGSSAKLDQ